MEQLVFISFLWGLFACNGQTKPSKPDTLTGRLASYYNKKLYDSIFYLFSQDMKETLPLKNTTDFFFKLQADAGGIEKYEFVTRKESFARYRADFSKAVFWLDISQNQFGKIDGLLITPYDGPGDKTTLQRNQTKISLPFSGEWFVFWGGDTKEQNYHMENRAQKNAFDIVIADTSGKTYKTNGKSNEDYYAFGQPLIAPCDAEVIAVTEGIKDNVPGEMNTAQVTGNSVILKTANNEYLLFAHFKLNSIKVKPGESIRRGQLLGLCGNSGNSSEPHLHFHIQDKENMAGSTGIKCYFDKILVNGVLKTDYSPVKGDRIKHAD